MVGGYYNVDKTSKSVIMATLFMLSQRFPNTIVKYNIVSAKAQVVNGINYDMVAIIYLPVTNCRLKVRYIVHVPPIQSTGVQLPPELILFDIINRFNYLHKINYTTN